MKNTLPFVVVNLRKQAIEACFRRLPIYFSMIYRDIFSAGTENNSLLSETRAIAGLATPTAHFRFVHGYNTRILLVCQIIPGNPLWKRVTSVFLPDSKICVWLSMRVSGVGVLES